MSRIFDFINLARPHQYVKNGFIFLPLFFGAKFYDIPVLVSCLLAFVSFSLLSSCVYVINDLQDIEADRQHPVKKHRPLASGKVSRMQGMMFAAILGIGCLCLCSLLRVEAVGLMLTYLLLNLCYSYKLKHIAILDVVIISLGFVIRVFVGTVQAGVAISHWIVLMTFLLAMFLALAKRRDDLLVSANGAKTRKCLDGYSFEFVSLSMIFMAAVTIVSYIMFTALPEVSLRYGTEYLYLTTFWVLLGLLRYLQITFVEERSGSPTKVLIKDSFLQIVITCWLGHFAFFIYIK